MPQRVGIPGGTDAASGGVQRMFAVTIIRFQGAVAGPVGAGIIGCQHQPRHLLTETALGYRLLLNA